MQIKTKEDYIKSLKEQGHVVYYNGQRVEDVTTHPAFIPHINAAAKTYEMALQPEYEALATAVSHLTNQKISRFTHIHQSVDDPVRRRPSATTTTCSRPTGSASPLPTPRSSGPSPTKPAAASSGALGGTP